MADSIKKRREKKTKKQRLHKISQGAALRGSQPAQDRYSSMLATSGQYDHQGKARHAAKAMGPNTPVRSPKKPKAPTPGTAPRKTYK